MTNEQQQLQSGPESDPLNDSVVWTPEIERLARAVARWIRLDTPGGAIFGKQRNGKSSACAYLAAVLATIIGYPVATVIWGIPKGSAKEREFTQERMLQSGCNAISHRDMAVLRGRLYDHIEQLADAVCARRVIVIIDEAQHLISDHYGYLVHAYNELVLRQIRPFFLLVGQPELKGTASAWLESKGHHVVGRFHVNRHVFRGIARAEIADVLREFDKSASPDETPHAARMLPDAYASGWRIADLADPLNHAITIAMEKHNLTEDLRIPMQYLRSTVLSFLFRAIETRQNPREATAAVLLKCLRDAGFLSVISYYAEGKSEADDVNAME